MKMTVRKLVSMSINPKASMSRLAKTDQSELDPSEANSFVGNNASGSNPAQTRLSQIMNLDIWDFVCDIHHHIDQETYTLADHYRLYLERVRELYYNYMANGWEFPTETWAHITLCFFPQSSAWIRKLTEILKGDLIHDFKALLDHMETLIDINMQENIPILILS